VREETQDDDSDDEDPSSAAEESSHEGEAHEQKLAFAIDPQIDINSCALLNMISEEAVVVDQPLPAVCVRTATERKEISVDEAFDDW